ncbi:hypothetical protein CFIICLFH_0058 [Methylobacterium goesingense]|nr:hypothetical protein CFIICLFH_0058 [Methylobacterium goesingense]
MLARQHGGGGDDRHLLAGEHGGRGGAQGHLGLAEADIAADETVHRPTRGEVADHAGHGARLVGGEREAEAGGEALHLALPRHQHRRPDRPALLGIRQHHPGGPGHAGLRLQAAASPRSFRPASAFELVQGDGLDLRAVAPDPVGLRDRHHQDAVAGKAQAQGVLAAAVAGPDRLQSLEHAEPVVAVDRDVTDAQLDLADGQDGARAPGGHGGGTGAEEVGGGDHRHAPVRHPESRLDRGLQAEERAGLCRNGVGPGPDSPDLAPQGALGNAREPGQRLGGPREEDAVARLQALAQGLGQRRVRPGFPHEGRHGEVVGSVRMGPGDPALPELGRPILGAQIEAAVVGSAAPGPGRGLASFRDLLEEGLRPLLRPVLDHEGRVGHLIEHGVEGRVVPGQTVLLAREGREPVLRALGQEDLGGGVDDEHVGIGQRALRDRIVGADRGDAALLVLDAAGAVGGGREDVHGPAPDRNFAGLVDPVVEDVAEALQEGGDRRRIEGVADPDLQARRGPGRGRGHPLDQGRGGGEDDVGQGRRVGEPAQHAGARAHHAPRGRGTVVGQAVPFRVDRDAALRRQRPQDLRDGLQPVALAGHVDQGLAGPGQVEECDREGAGGHERRDGFRGGCRRRLGRLRRGLAGGRLRRRLGAGCLDRGNLCAWCLRARYPGARCLDGRLGFRLCRPLRRPLGRRGRSGRRRGPAFCHLGCALPGLEERNWETRPVRPGLRAFAARPQFVAAPVDHISGSGAASRRPCAMAAWKAAKSASFWSP